MAKETDQNKTEKPKDKETDKRKDAEKGVEDYFKKKEKKKKSLVGEKKGDSKETEGEKLRRIEKEGEKKKEGKDQEDEKNTDVFSENVRRTASEYMEGYSAEAMVYAAQRKGDLEIQKAAVLERMRSGVLTQEQASEEMQSINIAQQHLTKWEENLTSGAQMKLIAEAIGTQTPESLRVPTRERAKDVLKRAGELEDDEVLTNEVYETYVRDWFEERLEHLEKSGNQTFEEQQMLVAPIVLAYTQLELEGDTEYLGEEMRKAYETRRNLHRQSIMWRLNVLEGIFQGSSAMDTRYFKEIFTTATTIKVIDDEGNVSKEKRYLIAQEFRNYEAMGEELLRLKKEANDKSKKGREKTVAKTKVAEYQKEIMDYYLEGGYVRGEDGSIKFDSNGKPIMYGKEISRLEKLLKGDSLSDMERKKTEVSVELMKKEVWARKMAGRLFSITGRAGNYDIILNNLGDVFSTRLLNINAKLSKDPLHDGTKSLWDTEINGRKMDVGAKDFWTSIISRVQYRGDEVGGTSHKKGDIKYDTLRSMGITAENIDTEQVPQKSGKKQDKIYMVGSLKNARLEDEAFWDELFDNRGVGTGDYGSWIDKLNRADQTRKYIFGYGKFLNAPTLENYLKLGEVYDNYSGDAYDERGGDRFSEQQREWNEDMVRLLEWARKDAKKDRESDWSIFPETEAYNWIEAAYNGGMIAESQREKLHAEYVGYSLLKPINKSRASKVLRKIPIVGGIFNPVSVGGFKKRVGLMAAPFRSPMMRGHIIGTTLWETIKKMFGYVFADEV